MNNQSFSANRCYFCGGKTKIKNITVDFRWGDKLVVVENVPVEVCEQCGERYYSAEVSKKLDNIALNKDSIKKSHRTLEVPVFSWQ